MTKGDRRAALVVTLLFALGVSWLQGRVEPVLVNAGWVMVGVFIMWALEG